MKKISILGQKFEYKVFCTDEFGAYYSTEFYQGTVERTFRKYILFGEKITVFEPKLIFEVDLNIEDPGYTKVYMKSRLENKVGLLYRKQEIERGEII